MRRLLALALAICLAGAATAGPHPKAGLLWQRTGLPAVFPLIVKTRPGLNYYLTLNAPETGEAQLAAFVVGGAFFKVLVPPGTYSLRFASGRDWQGEQLFFGAETNWIEVPTPLTFKVRDFSTKGGHMVDLTNAGAPPVIEARSLCQRYALTRPLRSQPPYPREDTYRLRVDERGGLPRLSGAFFDPQQLAGKDTPAIPTDFAPYFAPPSFAVRGHIC